MDGVSRRRHKALRVHQALKSADLTPIRPEPYGTDLDDPVGLRHQARRFKVKSHELAVGLQLADHEGSRRRDFGSLVKSKRCEHQGKITIAIRKSIHSKSTIEPSMP